MRKALTCNWKMQRSPSSTRGTKKESFHHPEPQSAHSSEGHRNSVRKSQGDLQTLLLSLSPFHSSHRELRPRRCWQAKANDDRAAPGLTGRAPSHASRRGRTAVPAGGGGDGGGGGGGPETGAPIPRPAAYTEPSFHRRTSDPQSSTQRYCAPRSPPGPAQPAVAVPPSFLSLACRRLP